MHESVPRHFLQMFAGYRLSRTASLTTIAAGLDVDLVALVGGLEREMADFADEFTLWLEDACTYEGWLVYVLTAELRREALYRSFC